jgi:hypothetical protein
MKTVPNRNSILKVAHISSPLPNLKWFENYDLMLTDTIGKSFEKLNYFKRKINVVKVFNPIDFFDCLGPGVGTTSVHAVPV